MLDYLFFILLFLLSKDFTIIRIQKIYSVKIIKGIHIRNIIKSINLKDIKIFNYNKENDKKNFQFTFLSMIMNKF